MSDMVLACPQCERHNPPEYEQCWKCQHDLTVGELAQKRRLLIEQKQAKAKARKANSPYKAPHYYRGIVREFISHKATSATVFLQHSDMSFQIHASQPISIAVGDEVSLVSFDNPDIGLRVLAYYNHSQKVEGYYVFQRSKVRIAIAVLSLLVSLAVLIGLDASPWIYLLLISQILFGWQMDAFPRAKEARIKLNEFLAV